LRHLQTPQTRVARGRALALKNIQRYVFMVVIIRSIRLKRDQALLNELRYAAADFFEVRGNAEVHVVAFHQLATKGSPLKAKPFAVCNARQEAQATITSL
jgi:hypothetical protein